ncbi:unnamed protein product [Staurois parvus]|uniref:Uncharacterized protein n=1 Tax=Staurois parvus TaxID=386267 RepID=A0ABN9C0X3_9NEOB|nr:unnamed protein product [Staurois parvus]
MKNKSLKNRDCGHSTGMTRDCGHSTGMTRDCGHSTGMTRDCGQYRDDQRLRTAQG